MDREKFIADLNSEFATANVIFGNWKTGGLPAAFVRNEHCSGIVSPYGAHVLSFVPAGGCEVLMISKESFYEPRAIRGGVPVCWPWFGSAKQPGHGLARLQYWDVVKCVRGQDGSDTVEFRLFQGAPYNLEALFSVNFGKKLSMRLTTTNRSGAPVEFTEALHTYFKVGAAEKITVSGLAGAVYEDTVGGKSVEGCVSDSDLTIGEEVDYVYDSEGTVEISDPVLGRRVRIEKSGSKTTVVWNPWIAKSAAIEGFGNEEYHDMVCVEAANAKKNFVRLADGESRTLGQYISVEPL